MRQRQRQVFPLDGLDAAKLKRQVLHWGSRCSPFLLLDSCGYLDRYGAWDWLGAAGEVEVLQGWEALSAADPDWLFGHIAYEAWEGLPHFKLSPHDTAETGWASVRLFRPEVVIGKRRGAAEVEIASLTQQPDAILRDVICSKVSPPSELPAVQFQPLIDADEYIKIIERLREHIAAGDCYEINFCNKRVADSPVVLDGISAYEKLTQTSPAPFAAYYRCGGNVAMCSSPERYLRVANGRAISQPIKGTAKRGATRAEDAVVKSALQASPKERAENVMIVDLTRSDLARVCEPGSIEVEELFGIQTFPTVHQMVSTVSGQLAGSASWADAVRASFPMGSMTGAPKRKVMELISKYEPVRRGLFSGTVGYVSPAGDADFNVVIRSLFHDTQTGALSYSTGGAITWGSDPQAEWEETVLKGAALERLFTNPADPLS